MFGFKKPEVWRRSVEFADQIYLTTAKSPYNKRFRLTNNSGARLIRSRPISPKEVDEYRIRNSLVLLQLPSACCMECVSQNGIAERLEFVDRLQVEEIRNKVQELSHRLGKLRSSLENPNS